MKQYLLIFILLGTLLQPCGAMEQFEQSDEEKIIELLLPLIPDGAINSKNNEGKTLLFRAVELDNKDLIRRLLKRDADPRIPNNAGITPIELSIEGSRHRFTAYELKHAAQKLDARDGLPWKDYCEIAHQSSQQ